MALGKIHITNNIFRQRVSGAHWFLYMAKMLEEDLENIPLSKLLAST